MLSIPKELIEQIANGNGLLFVGQRILRDQQGRILVDLLTEELATRLSPVGTAMGLPETQRSFPLVAQLYEDQSGRHSLVQFVRERIDQLGSNQPQTPHRLIAALPDVNLLVTTCFDDGLERGLREAGRPYHVIVDELDVAFEDDRKVLVYKLHGSSDRPDSLILTEDDHETFFADNSNISVVLQSYLARKTILFVGYDLSDVSFRRLYRKVTDRLDHYARRSYAFGELPSPSVAGWGRRHGVNIISADTESFLESLTASLRTYARPASARYQTQMPDPASTPVALPYRRLDYYERQDAGNFFGRESESRELAARIRAHRLVLLHGGSGVGKTSLLLAGVVPQLESTHECLYVRPLSDPIDAIRLQLQRRIPSADLSVGLPLVDICSMATNILGRPVLLILDQFEEFFIHTSPELRLRFAIELQALYAAREVPAKVLLSLREDWLASVSELEDHVPTVFQNRMRLLPLTQDQARLAIVVPVDRLGVSYEDVLIEQLLADLTDHDGVIMPPQLQIVCSALYASLPWAERVLTLANFEQLGGTRGILLRYLDEELARFTPPERELARRILEALVTSQRTKRVATRAELQEELRVLSVDVDRVVDKLLQARLLRSIETSSFAEPALELAHEYLIEQVMLSPEAKARKEAAELLRHGVEMWQTYGTLLSEEAVTLVQDRRVLLSLTPPEEDLLTQSIRRHRRPGERIVVGMMGGLAGGAIGGAMAATAHILLLGTPESPMAILLGDTIAVAITGLVLGLAISLGRFLSERRWMPIGTAALIGAPVGILWSMAFGPESTHSMVSGLLGGVLMGAGVGLGIVLAAELSSRTRQLFFLVLSGALAGAVFSLVTWQMPLLPSPVLAATGIALGIGLAVLRAPKAGAMPATTTTLPA